MRTPWTITNKHDLEILGDTHTPEGTEPIACVLLLHGFKGYKDYGFIPILAHDLCEHNMLVHRFNFSTSGMTNNIETFERPDLFEKDTWNRQVEDVLRVIEAVEKGEIAGKGLPLFLVGHSRGGATALLTGGRHHDDLRELAGIVTINAVDTCCKLPIEEQEAILERGYMLTRSNRTGQELKVDAAWIDEQQRFPREHEVLYQAGHADVPVCVIQGDSDDAVDLEAGESIARATRSALIALEGSDHVLNMPNPSTPQTERSVQLLKAEDTISRFITKHAGIARS